MTILVIDHNTAHKPLIAKLIAQKLPKVSTIAFVGTHDVRIDHIAKADLVIVSGGTLLVHKNPGTHRRLNDLLVKSGKPVIAICLGAESFAQYFGMEIAQLEDRISGPVDIQLSGELALYLQQDNLRVFEHHRYTIPVATDDVEVLATSSTGIESLPA